MRVIVTLATAQWRQWPDHVRQRAIDLYPRDENIEFWDAGNREGDSDYELWGAWPRFSNLGPEALVADMVDEILTAGESPIAILLVLEAPSDLVTDRGTVTRNEAVLHHEHIKRLDSGLREVTTINRRILRLGVFRSGATRPGERAIAWSLVTERLLDGVVFIDVAGEGRDVRQFDALRLLIDAARTGSDNPAADWLRASLVSGMPSGGMHWLRPPERSAVTLAGAQQASLISGFIRSLTEAEGIGRGGEALTPLNRLEEEVKLAIEAAENRRQLSRSKADEDEKANADMIEAAGLPHRRTEKAVQAWWSNLAQNILDKYSRRPEDVAVLQMGANPIYIRGLDTLLRQATEIAGGASGLTENARRHCEKILETIEDRRRDWGDQAHRERQTIDRLLTEEEGLVGADGRFHLNQLHSYHALEDTQLRELRHLGSNMPSRGWTAAVAAGLTVSFYVLFAVQTNGWARDDDWLAAIALGPTWARIGVLVLIASIAAALRTSLHERAESRWRQACDAVRECTRAILDQAHQVVRHTMLYRGCTEVAAGLAPVQARMNEIVAGMKDGKQRLNDAARLLRATGFAPPPDEQEKFNERQAQLKSAPVREWVRRMLATAQYSPEQNITLAFGMNRTGGGTVTVRSRLEVSCEVQVEGLVP